KDGLVPVKPLNFQLKALPIYLEGYVHKMRIAKTVEERKAIHSSVMESELVDSATGMLKVTGSLNEQPIDAGRGRLFQKSWFERETVWMHMFLKYVYELINNGMYEEFYELFEHIVPFLDPNKYGNTLFNSSMIVSDAAEDETLQSAGFIARLSGATASMLSIWLRMHLGREPFYVNDNGELVFSPQPALKADMFLEENGSIEYVTEEGVKEIRSPKGSELFNFRDGTIIRYINPEGKDTFGEDGVKPVKYVLTYADSGKQIEVKEVVGELAEDVRSGKFSFIDISLATEKLDQNQKNNSMISEEEKKELRKTLEGIIANYLSNIKKPVIHGSVTAESLNVIESELKSKSDVKTERKYLVKCFYMLLKYLEQDDFNLQIFEGYKMSFSDSLDAIVLTDGNDNNSVKGGIDLDPAMMDLQIKRDGNGVPLPVFQQPLDMINIKGFVPVIINVTPILNLPLLLGFADSELPINSTESDSQTTAFDLSLVDKYRNKYTDRYEHQNNDIDA
ncbi:MAG: hypothetical protein KAR32_06655, partial [Candidatus Omnitrophica bacterium]|nr:hypothetical protein [Candidatus Omnitrophota bacterium]